MPWAAQELSCLGQTMNSQIAHGRGVPDILTEEGSGGTARPPGPGIPAGGPGDGPGFPAGWCQGRREGRGQARRAGHGRGSVPRLADVEPPLGWAPRWGLIRAARLAWSRSPPSPRSRPALPEPAVGAGQELLCLCKISPSVPLASSKIRLKHTVLRLGRENKEDQARPPRTHDNFSSWLIL